MPDEILVVRRDGVIHTKVDGVLKPQDETDIRATTVIITICAVALMCFVALITTAVMSESYCELQCNYTKCHVHVTTTDKLAKVTVQLEYGGRVNNDTMQVSIAKAPFICAAQQGVCHGYGTCGYGNRPAQISSPLTLATTWPPHPAIAVLIVVIITYGGAAVYFIANVCVRNHILSTAVYGK